MGFFDKYKVESVPQKAVRQDTADLLKTDIDHQLKLANGEEVVVKKKRNDKGVLEPIYLKSWYDPKTGYVRPKCLNLSLFPETGSAGGGQGVYIGAEGNLIECLNELKSGLESGELDKEIADLDRRRVERDEKIGKSRKKK